MRIALVSPYDFAYPGGVVNHISCLEQHFTAMGHDVRVIAPASKSITAFGDRFIPVGKPRPVPASGSVARITLSLLLGNQVKEIFEREQFDICHLHEPLMPMLCTTVLRLCPVPTVGTFHASGGKPWYSFWTPVGKHLLDKWFQKLDSRVAVSDVAAGYANRFFPADYKIIPNGIDSHHFRPDVSPVDRYNDGKLNILFVGRMEKRKGVNDLIDAFRIVKEQVPESRLILVGPGTSLRRFYEAKVLRYGIKDVVFEGFASYDDLPRFYKRAHVVCLPATGHESFGIVLLEAMAVGKPIVATDIDGYRSVVTNESEGLLVPPRNPQKLAESLLTLLRDESLRWKMGRRGEIKAVRYDWDSVSQLVMDEYNNVLNRAGSKPNFLSEKILIGR